MNVRGTKRFRPELGHDNIREIGYALAAGTALPRHRYDCPDFSMMFFGKVVAKERPRFSGTHAYTSKATRDFEKAVAEIAEHRLSYLGMSMWFCPVAAHLIVREQVPQSWGEYKKQLALGGLLYPGKKDLDNQEKAIFDAMNGIVFADDSQIVQKYSMKIYGPEPGFALTLTPTGMTITEAENAAKIAFHKSK